MSPGQVKAEQTIQDWGNDLALRLTASVAHQPKSFDWRLRGAKAHPWKQVPPSVFEAACETLNQIIEI
ncbi:hypothetical protein QTI33_24050 [Variovorax sp. J22P271]|uniref:hypothetical protein n=1 Tax=Variovorax davisae TaxID=3053515 RepID=UPI002577B094|nr:hypothetical protein [Variovorax sp. J22P271]MDM0035229.1 hypothetical protein [Variovorax sp. J22P271]